MSDVTGDEVPESTAGSSSRDVAKRATRRRLLLGAAAALPSVYTLKSGAQTAATSAIACATRPPPPDLQRFTATDDNWVRKHVYKGQLANDDAYCVMWTQSSCVDPMNVTKANPGSVWMHGGSRVYAGNGTNITKLTSGGPYGLVYVDKMGTVKTIDPNGDTSLNPVVDSCWASVMGRNTSLLG
jgi:hypothetical protein